MQSRVRIPVDGELLIRWYPQKKVVVINGVLSYGMPVGHKILGDLGPCLALPLRDPPHLIIG